MTRQILCGQRPLFLSVGAFTGTGSGLNASGTSRDFRLPVRRAEGKGGNVMKKKVIGTFLAFSTMLSACSGMTVFAEEDNTIRVGAVCAMTGGSAIYGEGAQNAIDMAVEEINASDSEYKIEIVNGGKVADDAKDAKQAVNAYNSLMKEEPDAIVGSFFSAVTLPMAELAADDNMLLLATGATNYQITQIGPTIFRNCFIDPYQGKMAAEFAKDQGYTSAAIIYAKDDDYSNGLKDAFV